MFWDFKHPKISYYKLDYVRKSFQVFLGSNVSLLLQKSDCQETASNLLKLLKEHFDILGNGNPGSIYMITKYVYQHFQAL